MPEPTRAPLFTAGEIRTSLILSGVGMAGLLVLILLLASSRPQGAFQAADDDQFRATVAASAEYLEGYELVGSDRARIAVDRAIELVAERGVDLALSEAGADTVATVPADAGANDGEAAEAPTEIDGSAVYAANCAACHQGGGQGVPGAFPPLAASAAELAAADGGREYLIRAVVHGVQGEIEVQGQTYNGVMPAWPQLSDAEIAGVLNHVLSSWGNEWPSDQEPVAADEVAAVRGEELAATEVAASRPDTP